MSILIEAKKQLQPISVRQIKNLLKSNYPTEYSKMIIEDDVEVKRANFYYSVFNYTKSNRKLFLIKFPLFNSVKNDYRWFEDSSLKQKKKAIIKDEKSLVLFANQENASVNEIKEIESAFDFPFDLSENEISPIQRKYFIPEHTYKEPCPECKGQRYITCKKSECNGRHVWRCNECIGKGEVACSKCGGHGYTKCWSCSGKGKIYKNAKRANGTTYQKSEQCSKCRGRGEIACRNCGTSGKIRCTTCNGDGKITCSYCYSDQERFGKVDCPICLTTGKISQVLYVETIIENSQSSQVIKIGDNNEIKDEIIKNYFNKTQNLNTLYKNINGSITDNSDEISNKLLPKYEEDLNISKNRFPLLLNADIYYQIVPCVEFSYKHILTNEIHKANIVDIWNNPEIVFQSDAEKTKLNIKTVSKSVNKIFSKVFKTKGHKLKEDRKIEIKLMIYLAKSDSKIEEEEKTFLSEQISNLNDFTNSEKNELFQLMNADVLPELTKESIAFNDPDRGLKIISVLEKMALADGEFETSEKDLIEKLKNLMQ